MPRSRRATRRRPRPGRRTCGSDRSRYRHRPRRRHRSATARRSLRAGSRSALAWRPRSGPPSRSAARSQSARRSARCWPALPPLSTWPTVRRASGPRRCSRCDDRDQHRKEQPWVGPATGGTGPSRRARWATRHVREPSTVSRPAVLGHHQPYGGRRFGQGHGRRQRRPSERDRLTDRAACETTNAGRPRVTSRPRPQPPAWRDRARSRRLASRCRWRRPPGGGERRSQRRQLVERATLGCAEIGFLPAVVHVDGVDPGSSRDGCRGLSSATGGAAHDRHVSCERGHERGRQRPGRGATGGRQ